MRLFTRRREVPHALRGAFTLLEVLVSLAVSLIIFATLVQFLTNTEQVWKSSAIDPFAEAEDAFEIIASHLEQATLEPYQDYADATGAFRTSATASSFVPDHLTRRSDLAFVCGATSGTNGLLASSGRISVGDGVFFTAPAGYTQTDAHLGMEHLLNALGYFVEFSDEQNAPSFLLPTTHRWRWRLKEIVQPSESLQVYALPTSASWVQQAVQAGAPTSVLAENVVALLAVCEPPVNAAAPTLAATFQYDSRDTTNALTRAQLPARICLVLVAVDEASAEILAEQNGSAPPALVAGTLFANASSLATDLASLDTTLTALKVRHRIFQRDILLPTAAWENTPAP